MNTCIIIPARYGSTRFPGKPLAKIAGKPMLEHVVNVAKSVAEERENVSYLVATDDERIAELCEKIKVHYIITSSNCRTGSDRVLAALRQMNEWPEFVINLQGDAPFTPPKVILEMIDCFSKNYPSPEVVTPVHRLSWTALDELREEKKTTPFSGTTAVCDGQGRALWFSKNIIPAIRKEQKLREESEFSPVYRHLGIYGFRPDILEKFCEFEPSNYEETEGLEQLRLLENGIRIQTVPVNVNSGIIHSGIDSPEDIKRVEKIIASFNEEKRKANRLFGYSK